MVVLQQPRGACSACPWTRLVPVPLAHPSKNLCSPDAGTWPVASAAATVLGLLARPQPRELPDDDGAQRGAWMWENAPPSCRLCHRPASDFGEPCWIRTSDLLI